MVMRFIAGAVCPQCGERDTLRADIQAAGMPGTDDSATQTRECVDCGFSETQSADDLAQASGPGTRIEPARREDDRQVIRIMPDASRTKH